MVDLPWPKVPKDDLNDTACAICHEEYEIPVHELIEYAVRLPCNHVFGSGCIAKWLTDHGTCPLCRKHITGFHDEEEEADDDDGWIRTTGERHLENEDRRAIELRQYLQHQLSRPLLSSDQFELASRQEVESFPFPWSSWEGHADTRTTFRERLLLEQLECRGDAELLHVGYSGDQTTMEREETLFRVLQLKGVFRRHDWSEFTALADARQMFDVMRVEEFVWDFEVRVEGREERGAWVGFRRGGRGWGYICAR